MTRLNRDAVRNARAVCPSGKYVAGDIGPTGKMMAPLGAYRAVTMGALVVILVLALPNGVMGLFIGRRKRLSAG